MPQGAEAALNWEFLQEPLLPPSPLQLLGIPAASLPRSQTSALLRKPPPQRRTPHSPWTSPLRCHPPQQGGSKSPSLSQAAVPAGCPLVSLSLTSSSRAQPLPSASRLPGSPCVTPLKFPTENLTPPREVSGSLTAQKGRMFLACLPPNQALPARNAEAPTSGSGSCIPQCPAGNWL